jgi:hypothetical protein
MSAKVQVSPGARVLSQEGETIGEVKETSNGGFKVGAAGQPDFWLSSTAVMEVADGSVRTSIEKDHLDEFKAHSPEAAEDMDAIQVLLAMHGEAKAKFRKILETHDAAQARQIWEHLVPELKVHEEMEESYLYGPLAQDGASEELAHYHSHHQSEVGEVESMIQRSIGMEASDPEWRGLIERIHQELSNHIHEEESDIFPAAREAWSGMRLKEAGRQMRQMKEQRLGE